MALSDYHFQNRKHVIGWDLQRQAEYCPIDHLRQNPHKHSSLQELCMGTIAMQNVPCQATLSPTGRMKTLCECCAHVSKCYPLTPPPKCLRKEVRATAGRNGGP